MKKILSITILSISCLITHAQNTLGIYGGASATDHVGYVKPVIGAKYSSALAKRTVGGVALSYEPYKFFLHTGMGGRVETVTYDLKFKSNIIFISPFIGRMVGKHKRLHFTLSPSVGITTGNDEALYTHRDFRLAQPGQQRIRETERNTNGIMGIVTRATAEVQQYIPVADKWMLSFGGSASAPVFNFSGTKLDIDGGRKRGVRPLMFLLTAGLHYKYAAKKPATTDVQ